MFFSPLSIEINSLGEERANLSAFRTFVRFVLIWICRFPLPLGVREGLQFVIVALPGLFSYLFKLAVDASDVGAGGVLLQEDDNGVDHPVCYFSKKFNKNYSTVEKECLSLILALQHFEIYLTSSSSPFVVFNDHNPLTFIQKMKNKNQSLLRWNLLLQEYNLDIKHIKGEDNIIPGALSRV